MFAILKKRKNITAIVTTKTNRAAPASNKIFVVFAIVSSETPIFTALWLWAPVKI